MRRSRSSGIVVGIIAPNLCGVSHELNSKRQVFSFGTVAAYSAKYSTLQNTV